MKVTVQFSDGSSKDFDCDRVELEGTNSAVRLLRLFGPTGFIEGTPSAIIVLNNVQYYAISDVYGSTQGEADGTSSSGRSV